jgi:uncharacterized protein (DUF433 family)
MSQAAIEYAYRTPKGGWRVADSRVSLDSIVCAFQEGKTAEEIAFEFSALSLEQVHGALAYYLRNRQVIDEYLAEQSETWQQLAENSAAQNAPLLSRIRNNQSPGTRE